MQEILAVFLKKINSVITFLAKKLKSKFANFRREK